MPDFNDLSLYVRVVAAVADDDEEQEEGAEEEEGKTKSRSTTKSLSDK